MSINSWPLFFQITFFPSYSLLETPLSFLWDCLKCHPARRCPVPPVSFGALAVALSLSSLLSFCDVCCDTHSRLRKVYLIHCSFILSRSWIWVVLDLHLSDQHMGLQHPGPCPSGVAVLSLVRGCCPLLLPTLSCSSARSFLIVCQALLMVPCRCWIFSCYCKHPWALFLGVVELL